MGRRTKAPRSAHRAAIAAAAGELFRERGIAASSMDDIARAAGYSKATLYVYFANKEEIVSVLVLESMQKLAGYLTEALASGTTAWERYQGICQGLLRYQAEFPFYFRLALEEIEIAPERALPEDRETYRVGEAINGALARFLREGMAAGELRRDLPVLPTIFAFWGMLSGLIQTAANKEAYIRQSMGLTREAFLEVGFRTLYRSVAAGEETV